MVLQTMKDFGISWDIPMQEIYNHFEETNQQTNILDKKVFQLSLLNRRNCTPLLTKKVIHLSLKNQTNEKGYNLTRGSSI